MRRLNALIRLEVAAVLAMTTAALYPATAAAQGISSIPATNRFSVGPYAGVYFDQMYAAKIDNGPALVGGMRVGYALGARLRLLADVGYTDLDGVTRVGSTDSYVIWGANQWLTTGGIEFDLVPGRTSVSTGLEFGAIARQEDAERVVGSGVRPDFYPDGGYNLSAVAAPSLTVAHALTPRAHLKLSLRDYAVVDSPPWRQNFAVTLGLSLR